MTRPTYEQIDRYMELARTHLGLTTFPWTDNHGKTYTACANIGDILSDEVRALRGEIGEALERSERFQTEALELRAEMEGWKEEAGDAEELRSDNERLLCAETDLTAEVERLKAELAEAQPCCGEFGTGSGQHCDECPVSQLRELREAAQELADVCRGIYSAYENSSAPDEHGVQHLEEPLQALEVVLAKARP